MVNLCNFLGAVLSIPYKRPEFCPSQKLLIDFAHNKPPYPQVDVEKVASMHLLADSF